MKTTVIINEQHKLHPEQEQILNMRFEDWKTMLVPSDGWDIEQQKSIVKNLSGIVVFVSPIPYMIKSASMDAALNWSYNSCKYDYPHVPCGDSLIEAVFVMANDNRVKRELPNGKIISVVAQDGWYLA